MVRRVTLCEADGVLVFRAACDIRRNRKEKGLMEADTARGNLRRKE